MDAALQYNLEELVAEWLRKFEFGHPFAEAPPSADREQIIAEILASGSTAANPRAGGPAEAAAVLDLLLGARQEDRKPA